jgi:hypothetical protein
MSTSAIHPAIDGLVALCTSATARGGSLYGVTILDGPPPKTPPARRMLCIGDTPDDDSAAAAGTQEFRNLGANRKDEVFSIYCTAIARSGSTAVRPLRVLAFETVAAVENLLRQGQPDADPRLGGVVQWAALGGDVRYTPTQLEKGCWVEVGFSVECRARI